MEYTYNFYIVLPIPSFCGLFDLDIARKSY